MDIPDAPERFYANVNTSMNLTKNSAYVSVTLLADLVLVGPHVDIESLSHLLSAL
jgi:hypothetical protein